MCRPVRGAAGADINTCLKEMLRSLLPAIKIAVAQIRFSIIIGIYEISFIFILLSVKIFKICNAVFCIKQEITSLLFSVFNIYHLRNNS